MYIFSIDSLKFVIKELSGQPNPAGWGEGGGGGGVLPDGIYNVPLYRYGIQAAKSGNGYRNQRAAFG